MRTESGAVKALAEVRRGERLRAVDAAGRLVYSEVLLFLDRDAGERRHFVVIDAEGGARVTLTPSHLIYTVSAADLLEDVDLDLEENAVDGVEASASLRLADAVSETALRRRLKATFAHKAQIGDWILVADADADAAGADAVPKPRRIVNVGVSQHQGVYAPLTVDGTLVVDQVPTFDLVSPSFT